MKKRKISKRKIFIFISLMFFFGSLIFYGARFIHYYRIEHNHEVINEEA